METILEEFLILRIAGIAMMLAIVIVYSLCVFWDIKTFLLTRGSYHAGFILYLALACMIIVGMYVYLSVKNILGITEDITIFGTIFIRPAIFFLGGAIGSISRARYIALNAGGQTWIFPKHKI